MVAPAFRVWRGWLRLAIVSLIAAAAAPTTFPAPAEAFSVLAHQAIVDQSWDKDLVPLIKQRFPNVTEDQLNEAHSYARGGSHIQDLGYFPLGSREFSDLMHYVRTGDFVTRALTEASTPDEFAFALGALDHYEADSIGHPLATNLAVPLIYPKMQKQHGDVATYADSPSDHLETEFRFDVLQCAHREEVPDLFEHSIQFNVPRDFLEKIFQETYGFKLDDLFVNYDVAVATYRWGFRTLIHEATGVSWHLYKDDIRQLEPGISKGDFIQGMSRTDFESEFGKTFLEPFVEPGYFMRFFGILGNLVPNIGPLARLPYKPLPEDVQALYFGGFRKAAEGYHRQLIILANDNPYLPNLNLDTGRAIKAGEYGPADDASAELVRRHAADNFSHMPPDLAENLARYFQNRDVALAHESDDDRQKTAAALDGFQSAMKRSNGSSSLR